jgi:flagellar biosynthetic protein FliQ
MESMEVMEIGKEAIWVLIKISAPIMLVALGVGLIVSLFQALTQIQEQTLSFVPKMLSVFLSLILFAPYMISTLKTFTEHVSARIIGLH